MNNELRETIYSRCSCRSYSSMPVDENTLNAVMAFKPRPLYPEIDYELRLVSRSEVKCILPWIPQQLLVLYSKKQKGWLENAGFVLQQLDLYIQSLGLGSCWLGMGRMDKKSAPAVDGMEFVIMLGFGLPAKSVARSGSEQFKRKSLIEISDREDPLLEPARLAPSSINSQPWYFVHSDSAVHLFCRKIGVSGYMNQIDVGIALAHLSIEHGEAFRHFICPTPPVCRGMKYIISFTIESPIENS